MVPDELEARLSAYGYEEIRAHLALKDKHHPIHAVINKHFDDLEKRIAEKGGY